MKNDYCGCFGPPVPNKPLEQLRLLVEALEKPLAAHAGDRPVDWGNSTVSEHADAEIVERQRSAGADFPVRFAGPVERGCVMPAAMVPLVSAGMWPPAV
jgi:hypothetical protein